MSDNPPRMGRPPETAMSTINDLSIRFQSVDDAIAAGWHPAKARTVEVYRGIKIASGPLTGSREQVFAMALYADPCSPDVPHDACRAGRAYRSQLVWIDTARGSAGRLGAYVDMYAPEVWAAGIAAQRAAIDRCLAEHPAFERGLLALDAARARQAVKYAARKARRAGR